MGCIVASGSDKNKDIRHKTDSKYSDTLHKR